MVALNLGHHELHGEQHHERGRHRARQAPALQPVDCRCQGIGENARSDEWREEAAKRVWDATYRGSREARRFIDADFIELKAILTELGLAR